MIILLGKTDNKKKGTFVPNDTKGALTHHRQSRRWYCLLAAMCSPKRQIMRDAHTDPDSGCISFLAQFPSVWEQTKLPKKKNAYFSKKDSLTNLFLRDGRFQAFKNNNPPAIYRRIVVLKAVHSRGLVHPIEMEEAKQRQAISRPLAAVRKRF